MGPDGMNWGVSRQMLKIYYYLEPFMFDQAKKRHLAI
jgi:hypothetical protein